MKTGIRGIELIKRFEGCELHAYRDVAGIWTIGYGHTFNVHEGMVINQARANQLLQDDVTDREKWIDYAVKVKIVQHEYDALVSLCYNIGSTAFCKSTLVKYLNKGSRVLAANQFLRWNKAGGRIIPGLTKRRQAERSLFLGE